MPESGVAPVGVYDVYIRVLPVDIPDFTIVTDLGTTLTKSNFTNTGTRLEYYAGNRVEDIESASATGYSYSKEITQTSSHGDYYRYINVTFTALTGTDTVFRVTPVDIKTFEVRTNGGNFNKSLFTNEGDYWEYVRDSQGYSISYISAYGYTGSYTTSGGSGSTVYFDIEFTPDPTVIPPSFNLYAWTGMSGIGPATYVYTKRRNPRVGDNVYNGDCTLVPYSNPISRVYTNSTTGNVTSFEANGISTYLRADAINDLIVQPEELYGWTDFNAVGNPSVYTSTSTLTSGDILYDNEGMDCGLSINTIAQDGSFNTNSIRYVYRGQDNLGAGADNKFVISAVTNPALMNANNTKLLMSPFSDKVTNITRIDTEEVLGVTRYTFVGEIGGSVTISQGVQLFTSFDAVSQPLSLRDWSFSFYLETGSVPEYLSLASPINDTPVWDSTSITDQTTTHHLYLASFITSLYLRENQSGYYATPIYAGVDNLVNISVNSTTKQISIINPSATLSFRIVTFATCLTGDTTVTMANGEYRRIDEVQEGDVVLCINTDTLEFDEDEVVFSDRDQVKEYDNYDLWTFSEGYQVKTVRRHRFYNVEDKCFKYMDEWKIGEHTINQDGEVLELLAHENIQETVRHYKITTKKYHNYFANQMLTGSRLTVPFDNTDIKL